MSKERELLQRLVDYHNDWQSHRYSETDFIDAAHDIADEARALLAQEAALQELADQAQAQGWYSEWTDTPPSEPGWYWWWPKGQDNPAMAFVSGRGQSMSARAEVKIARVPFCSGQWQGPIKPRE